MPTKPFISPWTDLFLDWQKDADGYRVQQRARDEKLVAPRRTTIAHQLLMKPVPSIVRNGGRLITYDALKTPELYREFVERAGTPEGALAFVDEYGFPHSTAVDFVAVDDVIALAEDTRRLLALHEAHSWREIKSILDAAQAKSLRHVGVGNIGIVYRWEEGMELPQVRLRPGTLIDAMRVALLLDLAAGVSFRKCMLPGCPRSFKFGPGTGRRNTAHYCTRAHRQAHDRLLQQQEHTRRR